MGPTGHSDDAPGQGHVAEHLARAQHHRRRVSARKTGSPVSLHQPNLSRFRRRRPLRSLIHLSTMSADNSGGVRSGTTHCVDDRGDTVCQATANLESVMVTVFGILNQVPLPISGRLLNPEGWPTNTILTARRSFHRSAGVLSL